MVRALMLQGTASHVGKSVLTAAFARWLAGQGLRVAPFKAQNMSLNSFVTLEGAEIARSQAMQAEALGLEPTADMNPILLKPLEQGCQVIVQGRNAGVMSIQDYYRFKPTAWREITESYDRLASRFDVIVLEGAGSPAEINLREHDLVNMRMAEYAAAHVILVADIERGGSFAQIIGTWELLTASERGRVLGFVINKFQGDASLLRSGLDYVRERTGRPVLGVLPFDARVQLDEEDSLGLPEAHPPASPPSQGGDKGGVGLEIEIVVVRLPGISNFTDFAPLSHLPGVGVRYVSQPRQLDHPDMIVLPGTRTTIRAMQWLRHTGLAERIQTQVDDPDGPVVLGVCGGLQLLGRTIADPQHIESDHESTDGLRLLDMETRFLPEKTLHRVEGEAIHPAALGYGCPITGYEIHHGHSRCGPQAAPWLRLRRQPGAEVIEDGAVRADGRVMGCYVHGLFDDARFCRAVAAALRRRRSLPPLDDDDYSSQRELRTERYAHLVAWLESHCDLRAVAAALSLSS